jgi:aspartyl protease family protein
MIPGGTVTDRPQRRPDRATLRRWGGRVAAAASSWALVAGAHATTVSFSGMLGDRALLIIDGQAHTVPIGGSSQNVKLLRLDGNVAQVDIAGKTQILRLGGGAVVAGDSGGGSGGSKIVLPVGSGGHYGGLGSINGKPMRFMVDTGATSIAIGADVAAELGLDYSSSTAAAAMTANGAVATRRLTLNSVRVGDVTVYNVEAMVVPQPMPVVLLGNSFLSHFLLHNDSNSLVLEKKN